MHLIYIFISSLRLIQIDRTLHRGLENVTTPIRLKEKGYI